MTETTKTSIFLALALVLVGIAAISRPAVPKIEMGKMVGKALFPKFTDPLAVKKLEIVRPNSVGDLDEFRIAEVDGIWSIPSHENYPADAKEQMGRVAESLVDLRVLGVAADMDDVADATALYTLYGVIDPTSEEASLGEGVGVKVRLAGNNDETLVDLIIGKEVDAKEEQDPDESGEAGPGEAGKIRYVRVAGQPPVYEVGLDPKHFSTAFDQWIEKNLLDISTYDVKEVYVDDYSLKVESVLTQRGIRDRITPNFVGDMLFGYDGSATGAEKWSLKKWMNFRGANYEEYVERTLPENEELNIDVLDGMISALNDLKIVDVTKKPTAFASALREGKTLETIEPDPTLQKAGFNLVQMPDLRGGGKKTMQQLLSNEGDIQIRMKDGIRYTLRFGDLSGTESEIADETASPRSPEDPKTTKMGENRYLFITADFDSAVIAQPELKPIPDIPAEGDEDVINKAKAERESVEKSNQREQDRFNEAVEAGKKRAKKLMERFADWYYVIPEDVYKKIHLTGNNVFRVKKSEAAEHGEPGHVCDDDCDRHDAASKKVDSLPTLPGMENVMKPERPVEVFDRPTAEKVDEHQTVDKEKPETPQPETSKVDDVRSTGDMKPESTTEPPKSEESPPADETRSEPKDAEKKDAEQKDAEKTFDPFGGADPSQ